jgi:symmetrical bis(5'-nucleosyl)-tetraphosphatase
MALYCIGDVQGCDDALDRLLDTLGFSPSRDTIFVLGDLVNRGPDSLGVLRRLIRYGNSARCLLGNHDLHLLAVAAGARKHKKKETISDILDAPDRDELVDWVRQRDMAIYERGVLMVHAGVLPAWTCERTLALAGELSSVLAGPDHHDFMHHMYGDEPAAWDERLTGHDRLRVVVNALTRLRFCITPGRDGVRVQGGRRQRARGLPALVRRAGSAHGRCHRGLRALVHAGLAGARRCVCAGRRLRLGRPLERAAPGRRGPTRAHPGEMPADAEAWKRQVTGTLFIW